MYPVPFLRHPDNCLPTAIATSFWGNYVSLEDISHHTFFQSFGTLTNLSFLYSNLFRVWYHHIMASLI